MIAFRSALLPLLPLALVPALSAQDVLYESLTGWKNTAGSPNVTNNVTSTGSYFGKLFRVNFLSSLDHQRKTRVRLDQGTYEVTYWIKKTGSPLGRFDLESYAEFDGKTLTATTTAAAQVIDRSIATKTLRFEVDKPWTFVQFGLRNLNTAQQKGGYDLDTFALDRVGEKSGPVLFSQPIGEFSGSTRAWQRQVASGAAGRGSVMQLHRTGHTNFNRSSANVLLSPGNFIARFRFRKTVSTQYRRDINFRFLGKTVTIREAAQAVNRWINVSIPVTSDRFQSARAQVWNTVFVWKLNYEFADFTVIQDGTYRVDGSGCLSSGGIPTIAPSQSPLLGRPFSISMTGLPANSAGVMYHGVSDRQWHDSGVALPFDLSAIGMPRCKQYISTEFSVPFRTSNTGTATWGFTMPPGTIFLGSNFYNQAVVLDPGTNAIGAITTNYGHGVVGR